MKKYKFILSAKIGILILTLSFCTDSCRTTRHAGTIPLTRFEKLVFTIPPADLADSIRQSYPSLVPFYNIFNEEVIMTGPDSLPDYVSQMARFVGDSLMKQVYSEVERLSLQFTKSCRTIYRALTRWADLSGKTCPDHIVTYISGFNQSFVTLPHFLCLGVDNYMGSGCTLYDGLRIPVYLRKTMDPSYLAADAVRAWLYSELPGMTGEEGFLDRMISEGKIYYLASKILPDFREENLFHYSAGQLRWCRQNEKAMWKYLAEQRVLFSTDRLTIRKFIEEAPFTRDFGNDSPGSVGIWIGYRIISSYMKTNKLDIRDLIKNNSAKEILSGSKYHP